MTGPHTPPDAAPSQLPRVPLLALPAELTIYSVGELHPQWLACLAEPTDADSVATVQAAAVDEVDAAGLQLLLALQRALSERGRPMHIDTPSQALRIGCEGLGLGAWLQARTAEGVAA